MRKIGVYLCGGFYGNWDSRVIGAVDPDYFTFLNPRLGWSGIGKPKRTEEEREKEDLLLTQSPWWPIDRLAIEKCSVVFCYLQYNTPVVGAIFELGMCYATGKPAIVVDEMNHRYYRGITRCFTRATNLEEGIEFLRNYAWLTGT